MRVPPAIDGAIPPILIIGFEGCIIKVCGIIVDAGCVGLKLSSKVQSRKTKITHTYLLFGRLLLNVQYNVLGRIYGGKRDHHIDDTFGDIRWRCCRGVTGHFVRFKCTLIGEIGHERTNALAQRSPQRFVVGLKDSPAGASYEALFNKEGKASHIEIPIIICKLISTTERARAPDHGADGWKGAQTVDTKWIEQPILCIRQLYLEIMNPNQGGIQTSRCLPDSVRYI